MGNMLKRYVNECQQQIKQKLLHVDVSLSNCMLKHENINNKKLFHYNTSKKGDMHYELMKNYMPEETECVIMQTQMCG